MRLKTNLVVGLIFVGLLGYVYFFEIRSREADREQAEKSKRLLDFSDSEVRRVVVDRGDTTIVLEKKQGIWVLTEPVKSEADQDAVDRYLRNLRESERERTIADSAAAAADTALAGSYGLADPRLRVLLETEDTVMDTVLFGGDSPTETYTYAQQTGDNREIFTVRAWRFDNLDKGVFDLRDRRVLAFDQEDVREIRLARSGEQLVLARSEEDSWQLLAPVEAAADGDEVDDLLGSLNSAKVKAFVEEESGPEALSAHGLDPAALELSLLVGEDRAEKRLYVGAPEGEHYAARDPSRAPIFQVDSTLVRALEKEVFDLRDKEPLDFDSDAVTRIELFRADEVLVAEKDTAGVWTLVEPAGRDAKSWKLSRLVGDLEGLEVEEFVDDHAPDLALYRLSEPYLRIRLEGGTEEIVEVSLSAEVDGMVYAAQAGVPSVYRVEKGVLEDLDLKLEDVARPLETAD